MANSQTYTTAIESYFSTSWGARTAVAYDNVPFVETTDPPTPWVKVEVYDGTIQRESLGSKYKECSIGTAFFTVYGVKNEGTSVIRGHVDEIIRLFRSRQQSVGGGVLTFYDAKVKRIGEEYRSGAGSSISATVASTQVFSMVVAIGFRFDQVV